MNESRRERQRFLHSDSVESSGDRTFMTFFLVTFLRTNVVWFTMKVDPVGKFSYCYLFGVGSKKGRKLLGETYVVHHKG